MASPLLVIYESSASHEAVIAHFYDSESLLYKFKSTSSSQANEETDTLLSDEQSKNIASTTTKPDQTMGLNQTSTNMRLVLFISYL